MEVLLKLTKDEADKLHLENSSEITLDELKIRMSSIEMIEALKETNKWAAHYGISDWTMDDINRLIKEAREEHAGKNKDNN